MKEIKTIGLDLAKNVIQVHGVDARGNAVLVKQLKRDRVAAFFANLPSCLVGMEACGSAHYWARQLEKLGHSVRLIAPQFVKPYVKTNKNDAADAEAICEAVSRPNMPHPDYTHKSPSKSKYADSVVELDSRIGRIMDKVRELGLDKNTMVFYTTDNGAWQDVYPDAGYTPFRGTKGTVREGGNRVPAIAWMPGKIKTGTKNHDILGGLDLMATFASVAGVELPKKDREGQPIIFDSYDMSPVLFGTGKSERNEWFYFTENELTPGAARVGNYKAAFNLRGDNGQPTGGLAVDTNLGWKGPESYVATVPQVFDLWQDPQERYDIFMNNYTERTWTLVTISEAIKKKMETYVDYPPRPMQSAAYAGPITLSSYFRFLHIREQLEKEGVNIPLPTGN